MLGTAGCVSEQKRPEYIPKESQKEEMVEEEVPGNVWTVTLYHSRLDVPKYLEESLDEGFYPLYVPLVKSENVKGAQGIYVANEAQREVGQSFFPGLTPGMDYVRFTEDQIEISDLFPIGLMGDLGFNARALFYCIGENQGPLTGFPELERKYHETFGPFDAFIVRGDTINSIDCGPLCSDEFAFTYQRREQE